MFRFFKRKKDKPSLLHPVFQRMREFVRTKQQRAADRLQQKTMRFSKRTLITLLVSFCLLFGGSNVAVIIRGLQGSGKAITVQKISVPVHAIDTRQEVIKQVPVLTEEAYQNIQRFKQYMDSLFKSDRNRFDSILKTRPGLMDSIHFIESIYQEQLKSK